MDFISILSIFVLACFVGYYVVWSVTPALHTPLMSVTNAISSVVIVGAILASGSGGTDLGAWLGAVAVGTAVVPPQPDSVRPSATAAAARARWLLTVTQYRACQRSRRTHGHSSRVS